jgi:hypothetical protein
VLVAALVAPAACEELDDGDEDEPHPATISAAATSVVTAVSRECEGRAGATRPGRRVKESGTVESVPTVREIRRSFTCASQPNRVRPDLRDRRSLHVKIL